MLACQPQTILTEAGYGYVGGKWNLPVEVVALKFLVTQSSLVDNMILRLLC